LAQGELVLNGEIIHEDSETFIDSEGNSSKQTIPDHLRDLFERSVSVIQSEEEKDLVRNFLCEYADIFSTSASDTERTGVIEHDIFTGDHQPVKLPARRMPTTKTDEAEKAIDEMRKHGVIGQSTSPWSSPIVLVRKKDGSMLFCLDYRKLNNITKKDS
jgi:hypothetical protein